MASQFRRSLVNQIYNFCRQEVGAGTKYEIASQIKTLSLGQIKVYPLYLSNDVNEKIKYEIPISALGSDLVDNVVESEERDFKKSKKGRKVLICQSNPKMDMKNVLESDPTALSVQLPGRRILVDFSSPNIAKPFQVSHLRSTIIGNVISNIKERLGEKVVRINYLGDWGTHFGLLSLGIESGGYAEGELKDKPMELLLNAYEKANHEAESNPEFRDKALKLFFSLEEGDLKGLEMWEKLKGWTVDYLKNSYRRLGINFDEYHWESMYRKSEISNIFNTLTEKKLLETDDKQRVCAKASDKLIPLLKSDGSTLYLVRELGAIYDRREKHNFDEMYYVVDNSQAGHFKNLLHICETLQFDKLTNIHHVKFCTSDAISTRKSQVVFLDDVFDEARNLVLERQNEKETKIVDEQVADILGISAVVVNELKQSRLKPHTFDWKKILDSEADTGINLQYTHFRLSNLLERFPGKAAKECDPEALQEEQAHDLASAISKYEEKILEADSYLEPHFIAKHLLQLSQATNNAYQSLQVEGVDDHVASQRLLLFQSSKKVLEDGLKVLGLTPLEKM